MTQIDNHFFINPDTYKIRKNSKDAKQYLLHNGNGTIVANGRIREFKTKHIGAGIYEVWCEIKNK